jgi:hypothetical protein
MSLTLDATSGVDKPSLMARRSAPAPSGAAAGGSCPDSAERSRHLRDLRLSILRSLTTGVPGQPRVALYILSSDSSSAGERRAVALSHAGRAGFEVSETYVDNAWKSDPVGRSVLARAYTALRRGEIQGLVAASQADLSSCDSMHEGELRRLRAAGGFLHLALDETHI